jgi:hypothetical protein
MRVVIVAAILAAQTAASGALAETGPGQSHTARSFALNYLSLWSGPKAASPQVTSRLYAPVVRFHGRKLTREGITAEKRRFVQRWPVRRSQSRPSTMSVGCASSNQLCRVRSVFDFSARNPRVARQSRGSGTLELGLSFAGRRPVIVSETSRVHRRRKIVAGLSGELRGQRGASIRPTQSQAW